MYFKRLSPKSCSLIDCSEQGCNDPTWHPEFTPKRNHLCFGLSLQFMLPSTDIGHLRGSARTVLIGTKEILLVTNDWLAVFHREKMPSREISSQIHLLTIMKITRFLQREIHWYLVKPKMEIPTDRVLQPLKIYCVCVQGDIYTVDYFQHFSY